MLTILPLLLMTLIIRVSGTNLLSNTSTTLNSPNATIPRHSFYQCQSLDHNFDSCDCFGDEIGEVYGVDRYHMIDAICNACQKFTGGIGEPVSQYGIGEGFVHGEWRETHPVAQLPIPLNLI